MKENEPGLDDSIKELNRSRGGRFLRRIGAAVTSLVVGAGSFIAWDAWDTAENEPYIGPKVATVERRSDNQPTMPCRNAESILVTGSSMGLQVSEYMGRNVAELANQHNMCVWAVEMGTYL